jgi:hypothetical protein
MMMASLMVDSFKTIEGGVTFQGCYTIPEEFSQIAMKVIQYFIISSQEFAEMHEEDTYILHPLQHQAYINSCVRACVAAFYVTNFHKLQVDSAHKVNTLVLPYWLRVLVDSMHFVPSSNMDIIIFVKPRDQILAEKAKRSTQFTNVVRRVGYARGERVVHNKYS